MTFLDLFAGIGGFRSGLEAVGGFQCVGYCEIDPYPRRAYESLYDTREEVSVKSEGGLKQPSEYEKMDRGFHGLPSSRCESM